MKFLKKRSVFIILIIVAVMMVATLSFIYFKPSYVQVRTITGDNLPDEYIFNLSLADKIYVGRKFASATGNLLLTIRTKRSYACYLPIRLEIEVQEFVVEASIKEIGDPNQIACPDAIGPAFGYADLGKPRPLELSFIFKNKVDRYRVKFEAGVISVEPIVSTFTTYGSF